MYLENVFKLKKEDLEDILLRFSFKEENVEEAEEAFTIFYREYSKYLYAVVAKIKNDFADYYDDLIDAVVTNTFIKIYNKPPIHFKISKDDTDKVVNKKMKGYLAKVAKNELYDLLKKNVLKQEHLLSIDDSEIDFDPPDISGIENIELSFNEKLLKEILLTFKERDQSILLNMYKYHEEGKKSPKEVRVWLAKVHNTTELNIRKIKSRCEAKIKEHFEKHTNFKIEKS